MKYFLIVLGCLIFLLLLFQEILWVIREVRWHLMWYDSYVYFNTKKYSKRKIIKYTIKSIISRINYLISRVRYYEKIWEVDENGKKGRRIR